MKGCNAIFAVFEFFRLLGKATPRASRWVNKKSKKLAAGLIYTIEEIGEKFRK